MAHVIEVWLLSLLDAVVFVQFVIVIIATHCNNDRYTAFIRAYIYYLFFYSVKMYANSNSVDHYSVFTNKFGNSGKQKQLEVVVVRC